ncbi:uncharacterized protein LOC126790633 [Argentina anserina]|uniref:uncharacterized protein LOC126790633 n=1 Tax=Argentina anserina TaxID=57926 RepID=UPI00217628AB|nr:uncharacterized protein LOC126790633 [Potentilla anserina]
MMVIKKVLVMKTQFDFVCKRMSSGNMLGVLGSIWVFVCHYMFCVSGFISRYILIRFHADDHRVHHPIVCLKHHHQFDANRKEEEEEEAAAAAAEGEEELSLDSPIIRRSDDQSRTETEDSDQNRAETENSEQNRAETENSEQNRAETEDPSFVQIISAVSTDSYEYTSNRYINGYMEEPKAMSFTVQEFYADWDSSKSSDYQIPIKAAKDHDADHEKAVKPIEVIEAFENEELEKSAIDPIEEFCTEKVLDTEYELCEVEEHNCSLVSDSKQDPLSSRKDHDVGSLNYQFLIYRNAVPYDEGLEPHSSGFQYDAEDHHRVHFDMEDDQLLDVRIPDGKAVVFYDQQNGSESSDDDYIELLEPQLRSYSQQIDQVEERGEHKEELVQVETQETSPLVQSAEEGNGLQQAKSVLVSDDENNWESYEEHDDLIEQIKREIKNVRTGGLPTISEEDHSESTNLVENIKLKPLKIDEKFEYKDRIAEIQKVYKSYAEKMRKLDILNNQTMHAIGFLQLKDQVKPISLQKSSINPIMKSILSQNLLRCRAQRQTAVDPLPKFVGDLHKELELVYVGQVCLSWEILHWQHRKAHELQQYDHHHYNVVATEFQLFQVLLQRFIEDDPFQGPRVQHYVSTRCVVRSLLQVPTIRDDRRKDKKHGMGGEEEDLIIVSEMLMKIIEESMQLFWTFLRSDERNAVLRSLQESQVEHKDLELLIDIRKDLQKKEKKLKDIQRTGNCVVKKFQKQHQDQDRLEHSLFIAQVELRLVLRVLNMSKLTSDQLVWCHEKLDNINFVHRKVLMEPSFLLFPC